MSDPIITRVRRLVDESRNRGGMRAGMPKVTMDAADAERLCIMAESALYAPRVPEAMTEYKGYVPPEDGSAAEYYIDGWNDCRDEMLTTTPPHPESEGEELAKDAARYRWIRANQTWHRYDDYSLVGCKFAADLDFQCAAMLDHHIDAARLREGGEM